MGMLSILNVYEGDVKITFDTSNVAEAIRAKRIIKDMIRRGYALLIEVDGAYQRAIDFDEAVGEYVIADFDSDHREPVIAVKEETQEVIQGEPESQEPEEESAKEEKTKKRGRPRKRVPMETANAVAVARSAGG